MMAHVDLCSGIGGFALGFEWAGLSKPVLFCDIEPWSRKVLRKHWPDVPIAKDVKELADDPNGLVPECDILTAGYPCQPFSLAGERRGSADDRHIWPHIFSIIQAKRPSWCVFENVYGHVSMGLDEVLSDLEREGYAARPFIVPACATDAPHRRDRVWLIAHANSKTQSDVSRHAKEGQRLVADTKGERIQGFGAGRQQESHSHAKEAIFMRGSERPKSAAWLPEPAVGRVAHGIPRRVDRLRGLGNAIVPQIAQRIGETIKATL